MSNQTDETKTDTMPEGDDQGRGYHPVLELIVPLVMLISSVAYAVSLLGIANFDMNVLFLRPVFLVLWALLLFVVIRDVVPSLGRWREWGQVGSSGQGKRFGRFAPGTEGSSALVVLATFVFAVTGLGHGDFAFVASAFLYMTFVGFVLGLGHVGKVIFQAAALTAAVYVILGVSLGVRF